jgi:drug/metabolite transporter (DMT)-like permease
MIKNRYVGLICALVSLGIYLFLVFGIVMQLPVKADTFIMFSWPVVPGIIGGLVFFYKDMHKHWDDKEPSE